MHIDPRCALDRPLASSDGSCTVCQGNAKLHYFHREPPKPTPHPHNIGPSNADKTRSRDVAHAVDGCELK